MTPVTATQRLVSSERTGRRCGPFRWILPAGVSFTRLETPRLFDIRLTWSGFGQNWRPWQYRCPIAPTGVRLLVNQP